MYYISHKQYINYADDIHHYIILHMSFRQYGLPLYYISITTSQQANSCLMLYYISHMSYYSSSNIINNKMY